MCKGTHKGTNKSKIDLNFYLTFYSSLKLGTFGIFQIHNHTLIVMLIVGHPVFTDVTKPLTIQTAAKFNYKHIWVTLYVIDFNYEP